LNCYESKVKQGTKCRSKVKQGIFGFLKIPENFGFQEFFYLFICFFFLPLNVIFIAYGTSRMAVADKIQDGAGN